MPTRSATSSALPATLPIGGSTGLDNARDGTCEFHFGVMVGPDGCPLCNPAVTTAPIPIPEPHTADRGVPDNQPTGQTRASLPSRRPAQPMAVEPAEDLEDPIVIELGSTPATFGGSYPPEAALFVSHRGDHRPGDIEEGDQANGI